MRALPFLSLLVVVPSFLGCSADSVESHEDPLVEHIVDMRQRPDGLFDVRCRDGRTEIVTADQIRSNQVCNGGFPVQGTLRMQYTCNFSALEIRALVSGGPGVTERVDLTFSSDCQRVASQLRATRATINRPSFIAVCNHATLERFTVSPIGGLHRASATPFTFVTDCTQEESRINAPMSALPVDTARIDYTCSGNRTLEMRVVGAQGRERKEEHSFRFASDCTETAQALRPSRSDIRGDQTLPPADRRVGLGICDADNVLHLYAVTPLGDLSVLERRRFSFASDCRRAMNDANR